MSRFIARGTVSCQASWKFEEISGSSKFWWKIRACVWFPNVCDVIAVVSRFMIVRRMATRNTTADWSGSPNVLLMVFFPSTRPQGLLASATTENRVLRSLRAVVRSVVVYPVRITVAECLGVLSSGGKRGVLASQWERSLLVMGPGETRSWQNVSKRITRHLATRVVEK